MGITSACLQKTTRMASLTILSALSFLTSVVCANQMHYGMHWGAQGGARIRLSSKGLQYGASVGVGVLDRELKKVVIPDQGDSADIGIGRAYFTARGIKITNVKVPSYKVEPASGGRLKVSLNGVSVDAQGHVSGGVRTCFPYPCGWKICKACKTTISIGTGVKIAVRNVAIYLDADIRVLNKKPNIQVKACNVQLPHIGVYLTDKVLDVIYKMIAPILKAKVFPLLQKVICDESTKAIHKEANNFFRNFPDSQIIDKFARINYEFLEVSGNKDYLDLILRGEFQRRDNPQNSDLPLIDFPMYSDSSKMAYVWVSDRFLNTFGKIYHDGGLFKFVFTPDMIPKVPSIVKMFVNTDTLGMFFPDLAKKFPNRPMQFRAASYKPPTFHFSPGQANVRFFASANFDVVKADGTPEPAFWIKLDVNATGAVSVSQGGTRVHAKIDSFRFGGEVGGYTLGKFNLPLDGPEIRGIVQVLIWFVEPILEKGFPLPTTKELKLTNEKITFVENAARVEADLELNV